MKTETRIQQATIRLVLEYGYDKTTMEDIAREAGVARSTVYTKWKTREDLFAAVLKEEAVKFAQDWYRLVEADPQGGTFAGIYRNSLLALNSNPFVRALYAQNRRVLGSFVTYEQLVQLMNDRLVWTTKLFEMMQAGGMIRDGVDARTVAQMAVAFRQGLLNTDFSAAGEQAPGYEEVIDLFTAMLRSYIEVDPAGGNPAAGKQMLKDFVEKLVNQYAVDTIQKD